MAFVNWAYWFHNSSLYLKEILCFLTTGRSHRSVKTFLRVSGVLTGIS